MKIVVPFTTMEGVSVHINASGLVFFGVHKAGAGEASSGANETL